jgi:hypothetical protein
MTDQEIKQKWLEQMRESQRRPKIDTSWEPPPTPKSGWLLDFDVDAWEKDRGRRFPGRIKKDKDDEE